MDAHADLNTPETSPSGNVHGMPMAHLLGLGSPLFHDMWGGGAVLRPEDVVYVALRSVDPGERALIHDLGIRYFSMKEIDELGGAVAAINSGFIQRKIQDSAYRYQLAVEAKEQIIVGVNEFIIKESSQPELLQVDPAVGLEQGERLQAIKGRRAGEAVTDALASIRQAAVTGNNLFPTILGAVRSYATLGEICGVLREVYGEYQAKDLV